MSITGFNRRRREIEKAKKEAKELAEKEASKKKKGKKVED